MVKSLYTGVSGLKTHQQRMDVIGNNIANVNTIGNKADVVTFKDVYYQTKRSPSAATATLGGVNPRQVGYGVQMNSVMANMTQSGYTQSDNKWDMAINGNGFFQVMDGAGNIYYTRAGNFSVDNAGYLVNADGYHVLGVTGNSDGQPANNEIIRIVVPATEAHTSSATKKINGTNVTISVSAPSDYTDMTIGFVESSFPYATYANNILTLYFNADIQYGSQQEFEEQIALALQAGGVTLPEDVEIKFDIETIPDETEAIRGSNDITGYMFSTNGASASLVTTYDKDGNVPADTDAVEQYAYINFSVDDYACTDTVEINYLGPSGTINKDNIHYTPATDTDPGRWVVDVYGNTTSQEIKDAIKKHLEEAEEGTPRLQFDNWSIPSAQKEAILNELSGKPDTLRGVKDSPDGAFEFEVLEPGAFSNNYKITFAYVQGYNKTTAVWDENNLTINICANSTISEVNEAIKKAAGSNTKRIITFNNISGLALGDGYEGTIDPNADRDVWNVGMRMAFFGNNPSVNPRGGKDSFYTEIAKSLSTFNLTDGRTGDVQSYKDFTDIQIQQDGTIVGLHPVHGYVMLGRIDLATFDNVNGLAKVGGTLFQETVASGPAYLGIPGSGGTGVVLSGSLEMSNVDLADEFTNMITTQRGYQANSRVITVSDTMIEELLSLKR